MSRISNSSLALISTTATTVMVAIHHIFRLGPEVIIPALVVVALPLGLLRWLSATGSRFALWGLALVNGLIFVWFGLTDGILDHVLKAIGLENVTILPGGDAHLVETFYSLGSAEASAAFYEGTGIVQALASLAMLYFTVRMVVKNSRTAAPSGTAVAQKV